MSPDGPILFDLIAEVLQSGTVRKGGTFFDFNGGCTIVIDPFGRVRYAIYKRLDSVERQESQYQAMKGRSSATGGAWGSGMCRWRPCSGHCTGERDHAGGQ